MLKYAKQVRTGVTNCSSLAMINLKFYPDRLSSISFSISLRIPSRTIEQILGGGLLEICKELDAECSLAVSEYVDVGHSWGQKKT